MVNYKESKRVLRKAQRHAQFIYECKYIEKIEKSENIDSKLFWHLINKRIKPRSISCNPLKKDNGEYVSDPTDIVKCWKNHFNDIYTPSIASNDVDFSEVVNSTVRKACAPCSQVLDASVLISAKDVIHICSKMKCNTAYGYDKIYVENLKYGGPLLTSAM